MAGSPASKRRDARAPSTLLQLNLPGIDLTGFGQFALNPDLHALLKVLLRARAAVLTLDLGPFAVGYVKDDVLFRADGELPVHPFRDLPFQGEICVLRRRSRYKGRPIDAPQRSILCELGMIRRRNADTSGRKYSHQSNVDPRAPARSMMRLWRSKRNGNHSNRDCDERHGSG